MRGVRRWKELVIDREKWKDVVRQAKAHYGLYSQLKKMKKKKKKMKKNKNNKKKVFTNVPTNCV